MSRASVDNLKFSSDLTVDQFKELQQISRQTANYDPYCRTLLSIEASLTEANPLVTLEKLDSLADTYQTCPRFQYLRARTFESLGDIELMQQSIEQLQTCLRLIAATGSGTKESPYSSAFITDQADLVQSLGERKRCQQTVTSAKQQFDVVTAHSGREFWFDVTEIVHVSKR